MAEVGDGDHGLGGQSVIDRHRENHRLDIDDRRVDVLPDRRRAQDPEVEGAGAQGVALARREHVGLDTKIHIGQLPLDDPRDARQMGERGDTGDTDPDEAAAAGGDPTHAVHGFVHAGENSLGLGPEVLPGRGERHLTGGPREQGDVELGLELADCVRQRGLCHVQRLRCLPEMTGVGHGGEVPQVP